MASAATLVILVAAATSLLPLPSSSEENTTESAPTPNTTTKEVIYLLTLLPYPNPEPALHPSWDGGDDVQPVLDLAKDQVNRHPSVLENYTLELIHGRDGCDIVVETPLGFVERVFTPEAPRFAGIIGPGCSTSTTLLGPTTGQPDLSMVMLHGGGSILLANRTIYPNLVGTLGSTEGFVHGFVNLVRKASWKRLAILYDDSRLYYLSTKRLLSERLVELASQPGFEDFEVEILSPVSFNYLPLDQIQWGLLRVVYLLCPLALTQRILCLAHNRRMLYPNYQFAVMSHPLEDVLDQVSFTYAGTSYNCSEEDMLSAVEKMVFLTYSLLPEEEATLISNTTYPQYLSDYSDYRDAHNERGLSTRNSTYTVFATMYYDSVWAWALVLDNLTKSQPDFEPGSPYGNTEHAHAIVEQFYSTSFQGMSGLVSYDHNTGFTPRRIDIFQIDNSTEEHIASINAAGDITLINSSRVFIPDSFQNVTLRPNRGVAIFFMVVVMVQFAAILVLHVITLVYHKRPSIKATTPKLLHMSYVGIYTAVVGTFLLSLHNAVPIGVEHQAAICQVLWTWCLSIGITLTFLPVAMRTWRIYRIFKHYLNPGPLISDPILISVVLAFLVVDLVVAVVWTATSPFFVSPVTSILEDEVRDLNVVGVRYDCRSNHLFYWTGGTLAYKCLILFVFAVFAFLTRKIANSDFSTTFLRVLVFLLAIVLPLGFTIYYLIVGLTLDDPTGNYSFATLCVVLNVSIGLNIVCLFLPPVLPLFRLFRYRTAKALSSTLSTSKMIHHS